MKWKTDRSREGAWETGGVSRAREGPRGEGFRAGLGGRRPQRALTPAGPEESAGDEAPRERRRPGRRRAR